MFLVCVRACAHACTHIHCVCIWFAKFMRTFTHTHKQVRMHTKHKYKYARINGCTHAGRVWLGGVVRKGGPVKVLSGLPDGLTEQPDPSKVGVCIYVIVCVYVPVWVYFSVRKLGCLMGLQSNRIHLRCVYLCDRVCLCASVSILFCQKTGLLDGLTEQPDPPKVYVCIYVMVCVCASVNILFCQKTGLSDGLTEQIEPLKARFALGQVC